MMEDNLEQTNILLSNQTQPPGAFYQHLSWTLQSLLCYHHTCQYQ